MEKIKITINGENRIVIIPMEYDEETDVMSITNIQMEPKPTEDEDLSKDLVFYMANLILSGLQPVNKSE